MPILFTTIFKQFHWQRTPVQAGILITLLILPAWGKLPGAPPPFSAHYITGFAIFWTMLFTSSWWLLTGCYGLRTLGREPARALWALALLVLAVWVYASGAWAYEAADHPEIANNGALQFAIVALFAIVTASRMLSPRLITTALIIGVVVHSVIVILQAALQTSVGLHFLGEFKLSAHQPGVSVLEAGAVRWLRPYGLASHPNIIAGFLSVGLLAAADWITAQDRRLRWIGTWVFLLGLFALLLTFSRGAWVGFGAGAAALLPLIWRRVRQPIIWRQVAVALLLALLVGASFLLAFRPLVAARAGVGMEGTEQRSIADRVVYTEIAYRVLLGDYAHPRTRQTANPLLGLGIGNFPWYAADFLYFQRPQYDLRGDNVHHVMLLVYTEVGLIGLGLVSLALCAGIEASLRAVKNNGEIISVGLQPPQTPPEKSNSFLGRRQPDTARAALLAGVVALMIAGLFDHYPWSMPHYQIVWWGLLAAALAPPHAATEIPAHIEEISVSPAV